MHKTLLMYHTSTADFSWGHIYLLNIIVIQAFFCGGRELNPEPCIHYAFHEDIVIYRHTLGNFTNNNKDQRSVTKKSSRLIHLFVTYQFPFYNSGVVVEIKSQLNYLFMKCGLVINVSLF